MSAIIRINRGGTCGICQDEFSPIDEQFSHVGGEGHDGFHRACFVRWLVVNLHCPYDQQAVDPSLLISRTERMMARLEPVLVNVAYAAAFGAVTGEIARRVGVRIGAAGPGEAALVGRGTAIAGSMVMGMEIERVITGGVRGIVGENIITILVETARGAEIGVTARRLVAEAGTEAAILAVEGAVGLGMERILIRREVNRADRRMIGLGMHVAGLAIIYFNQRVSPRTAVATAALLGGSVAGALSLVGNRE